MMNMRAAETKKPEREKKRKDVAGVIVGAIRTLLMLYFVNILLSTLQKTLAEITPKPSVIEYDTDIKGVNYYPSTHPWTLMWDDTWWESGEALSEIEKELDIISKFSSVVRIFLNYDKFGRDQTVPEKMVRRLNTILDAIGKRKMRAIVALFDWLEMYDTLGRDGWTRQRKHLENILNILKDNEKILIIELKCNLGELLKPLGPYEERELTAWGYEMMYVAKGLDRKHIITIGMDAWSSIRWFSEIADICCAMAYKANPDENKIVVAEALNNGWNRGKPCYVSETGWCSCPCSRNPDPGAPSWLKALSGENYQKSYIEHSLNGLKELPVGMLVWCFSDYTQLPPEFNVEREKHFGIVGVYPDLKQKPSYNLVTGYKNISATKHKLLRDVWNLSTTTDDFSIPTWNWSVVKGTATWTRTQVDTDYVWSVSWADHPDSILLSDKTITDGRIRCRLLLQEESGKPNMRMGVVFRYSDQDNYYEAYIDKEYNSVSLRKWKEGAETLLNENYTTIEFNKIYELWIECHGPKISVWAYDGNQCKQWATTEDIDFKKWKNRPIRP